MGATIKTAIFWNVTPCSLVDVCRYFTRTHSTLPTSVTWYCEHAGSTFIQKVGKYLEDFLTPHSPHHLQVTVLLVCSDFKVYIGIRPLIFVWYNSSYSVFSCTLVKSFSKSVFFFILSDFWNQFILYSSILSELLHFGSCLSVWLLTWPFLR